MLHVVTIVVGGIRLQNGWFNKKCLVIGIILLFNGLIYTPFANADDTDNDLVFIHHSSGQNWLNSGLHNALLAKDYIDERNDIYYNTDVLPDSGRPDSLAPIPGDNTNMNHWILWFNDYLESVKDHGCADGFNKIIMFKSCFPISNIVANGTEPGDPFSSTQTIVNYKAVYRHPNGSGYNYTHDGYIYKPLEDVFADNPDVLFIPVAAPPLCYNCTNDENAHRARVFNNWLKNEWLDDYNDDNPGLDNVAVYDWFDFLANPDDHPTYPNRLKAEYCGGSGNSHPNTLANQQSTQDFATNPDNFIDTAWNDFFLSGPLVISNPSPSNGATDVSVDLSMLNVTIEDPEGDSFNWTIETSPDIGSASANDDANGTKTCSVSGLDFNTTYTWYVNATDIGSGEWTNETYWFITMANNPPAISNEIPGNGSINISPILSQLSVNLSDPEGDLMDYSIETFPNIGNGSSTDVNNGTISIGVSNLSYSITYHWYINVTDPDGSGSWTNKMFKFTTESISGPWWNSSWKYRKIVLINHTLVDSNSDLINFPVLINLTDSNLSDHAQFDGDDIVFTDYSGNRLHHEIEFYDGNVGQLVAWVNISILSDDENTKLYLYYGNMTCDNQEHISDVWDSDYRMVQHLPHNWIPYDSNPIGVGGMRWHSVFKVNDTYYAYYHGSNQIERAISPDGKNWTDDKQPSVTPKSKWLGFYDWCPMGMVRKRYLLHTILWLQWNKCHWSSDLFRWC